MYGWARRYERIFSWINRTLCEALLLSRYRELHHRGCNKPAENNSAWSLIIRASSQSDLPIYRILHSHNPPPGVTQIHTHAHTQTHTKLRSFTYTWVDLKRCDIYETKWISKRTNNNRGKDDLIELFRTSRIPSCLLLLNRHTAQLAQFDIFTPCRSSILNPRVMLIRITTHWLTKTGYEDSLWGSS